MRHDGWPYQHILPPLDGCGRHVGARYGAHTLLVAEDKVPFMYLYGWAQVAVLRRRTNFVRSNDLDSDDDDEEFKFTTGNPAEAGANFHCYS